MKTELIIPIACLAIMTSGGCVLNSTYNAAIMEKEAIKGDLERTKEEREILARQVAELEQLNRTAMQDIETAAAAARQAEINAATEQRQAEMQQTKLRVRIPQLMRQYDALRGALAVAKENGAALQELTEVYQKKLAELPKEIVASSSSVTDLASTPFDPAALPPGQTLPDPAPAVTPGEPIAAPPPVIPPAPTKQDAEPADSGWLSTIKDWLVSIWQSVFS